MPLPVSTQKHSRVQSNAHSLALVSVQQSTAAYKRWNPPKLVQQQGLVIRKVPVWVFLKFPQSQNRCLCFCWFYHICLALSLTFTLSGPMMLKRHFGIILNDIFEWKIWRCKGWLQRKINTCKQRKWNRVIFHGEKYILMLHLNSGQLDLIIAKVATNC